MLQIPSTHARFTYLCSKLPSNLHIHIEICLHYRHFTIFYIQKDLLGDHSSTKDTLFYANQYQFLPRRVNIPEESTKKAARRANRGFQGVYNPLGVLCIPEQLLLSPTESQRMPIFPGKYAHFTGNSLHFTDISPKSTQISAIYSGLQRNTTEIHNFPEEITKIERFPYKLRQFNTKMGFNTTICGQIPSRMPILRAKLASLVGNCGSIRSN